MCLMPGGKCMLQSDKEAEEEYALVQRLLPLLKKTKKSRKKNSFLITEPDPSCEIATIQCTPKKRKLNVGDVI
jgi:hypothetical protein